MPLVLLSLLIEIIVVKLFSLQKPFQSNYGLVAMSPFNWRFYTAS